MHREYDSLMANQVWKLVPRRRSKQPTAGKQPFALKMDSLEQIFKHKARFLARDFSQAPELDYHERCAPTARLSILRKKLTCGVQQGAKCRTSHQDLNGAIDKENYLDQPEDFKNATGDLFCKLKRSLYGLQKLGCN